MLIASPEVEGIPDDNALEPRHDADTETPHEATAGDYPVDDQRRLNGHWEEYVASLRTRMSRLFV